MQCSPDFHNKLFRIWGTALKVMGNPKRSSIPIMDACDCSDDCRGSKSGKRPPSANSSEGVGTKKMGAGKTSSVVKQQQNVISIQQKVEFGIFILEADT